MLAAVVRRQPFGSNCTHGEIMEVATIYRCLRGLGTSWAHYWINMVLAWPKSRCYTVAVSMEMLGNACSRMRFCLHSSLWQPYGMLVSGFSLQLSGAAARV
jgi:hypothetical protein